VNYPIDEYAAPPILRQTGLSKQSQEHPDAVVGLGKGGGVNVELHPLKMQIYRRSTLTISGFNVIFILQFPQALCPSCTFLLWTEKERSVGGVGGKQIFYCPTWGIWLRSSQVYCVSGKKGICRVKTGENLFILSLFFSLVFLFLLMWLFSFYSFPFSLPCGRVWKPIHITDIFLVCFALFWLSVMVEPFLFSFYFVHLC